MAFSHSPPSKTSASFVELLSVPSVPGMNMFDVTFNHSTAWLLEIRKNCIIELDIETGKIISKYYLSEFKKMQKPSVFSFVICSVKDALSFSKTYGLILVIETLTHQPYIISVELKSQLDYLEYIDECELPIGLLPRLATLPTYNNTATLFKDANGDIYYFDFRISHTEANRRTLFNVVKLIIDEGGHIHPMIISKERSIRDLWFQPFITDNAIYFLPFNGYKRRIIRVPFDDMEKMQIHVIDSDDSNSRPPLDNYSNPCVCYGHFVLFYIWKCGEYGALWILDLQLKKWKLHVNLSSHALSDATLVSARSNRIFLHGNCTYRNCLPGAHLYHFTVSLFGQKKIALTLEQLSALGSPAKLKFLHGPKKSGKTTVLLLAVMDSLSIKDNVVRIFVSSSSKLAAMRSFFANAYPNFDPNHISLLRNSFPKKANIPQNCHLFVDDLKVLTFELQQFLQKEVEGCSFIVMDHEVALGFDHPRDDGTFYSWHRLCATYDDDSRSDTTGEQINTAQGSPGCNDKTKQMQMTETMMDIKRFVAQSKEALDQFYPDWWSDIPEKDTICIPACLNVIHKQYQGPADPQASGFDPKLFAKKECHVIGQSAEEAFLYYFQKLNIGGLLISGFDTQEFATKSHVQNLLTAGKIDQFEVDSMFIHPRLGIYLIEIKGATKLQDENSSKYQKARKQLQRMLKEVPNIVQELTGIKFDGPLHAAICFPFAIQSNFKVPPEFAFIDQSALHNPTILRKIFTGKMQDTRIASVELLHQFACIMAGYRSMEFMSAGQNALAIHKMIESQSFFRMSSTHDPENRSIFLTNEQLSIIDCKDMRQVIIGPPGTGKTLILLTKALEASKRAQRGDVRIFTSNSVQLSRKFQIFFDIHIEEVVRMPIVDTALFAEPDDDVFFDELSLDSTNIKFLSQRINAKGCTIAALTGLENPLQIVNADAELKRHGLSAFHIIRMNTVIRSTGNIFNEVKKIFSTDVPLYLGHNIKGPRVKHFIENNEKDVLELVYKEIQQCLKQGVPQVQICVIAEDKCDVISGFLASRSIACGSVEEQLVNPSLIAVELFQHTLSFEWPIVIVVSLSCIDFYGSFLAIAASRCIGQLIIAELDYIAVQENMDKLLKKARNDIRTLKAAEFLTLTTDGRNSVFLENRVTPITMIRQDFCPVDLPLIAQSASLTMLFDIISKHNDLCSFIVRHPMIKQSVTHLKNRSFKPNENLPVLFDRLWLNIPAIERESRWRVYVSFVNKLIFACPEEEIVQNNVTAIMGQIRVDCNNSSTEVITRTMSNFTALQGCGKDINEQLFMEQMACPAWLLVLMAIEQLVIFCQWQ